MHDLIIIGAGAAGLSAAIYSARAGLKTLVVGKPNKAYAESLIENYLGFPKGIKGKELIALAKKQAKGFGAEFLEENAVAAKKEGDFFLVESGKESFSSRALILAVGLTQKPSGIKNQEKFEGKGIHFCAMCDGPIMHGKKIFVVGEKNFAAKQALLLSNFSSKIIVCLNGGKKEMDEKYLAELKKKGIKFIEGKIVSFEGKNFLEEIVFEKGKEKADAVFIAVGSASAIDFCSELGILTKKVFIETNEKKETNVNGVFAAGDCTGGVIQVAKAVGDGAIAAVSAINFLRPK